MHIAYLTTEYPLQTSKSGGIGTSICNLARLLSRNGISVSVLYWGAPFKATVVTDGIEIIPIPREGNSTLSSVIVRLKLVRAVNRIVKQNQVDVLEVPDWEGNYAFGKICCPVVMRMHCSNLYFGSILNNKVPLLISIFERIAAKKVDGYIACSQQVMDVSRKVLHINNDKPSKVIYNIVDESMISRFRKEFVMNHRVVFYGTIVEKKGVKILPYVFNLLAKEYSDVEFFIIGKDTKEAGQSVSELVSSMVEVQYHDRFHMMGPLPYEEMLSFISDCALCLLPSKAEGMPLVLIEGMMLQKCIVTSDIPCLKEVSTNEKDVLQCPVNDPDSYYRAIKSLFENENLASELAHEAFTHAKEVFSKERILNQNLSFYNSLVKQ